MEPKKKQQFSMVVQDCRDIMYRMAYRILRNQEDAKDAVGEAMVRAYENMDSLQNKEKLDQWILRIVINVANTMWLKKNREVCQEREYISGQGDNIVWDVYDELWDVLEQLPRNQRDVLHLFYYEEYEIEEISEILNIPVGTVKSRLNRGKNKLKKMLKDI